VKVAPKAPSSRFFFIFHTGLFVKVAPKAPSSRFFFIFHTGLFVKVAPPEYPPEVDILPRSGASAVATSLPLTRGATFGCSAPSSRFFYFYLYFYK